MRTLSQVDVVLQRVFDWSQEAVLVSSASYAYTQQLAAEAWKAGAEAILVPSATGIDSNLVIFIDNLAEDSHIEVIKQITDLRPVVNGLG